MGGRKDSTCECWRSSGPSEELVSVADCPRWRISLPFTCKCWCGWKKFMILGNRRDVFFSLQWRKHGKAPTFSMPWSPDRLFFKDFHKSTLQTGPIGESGVYILQREMDVLTFSSNHCTKFLPTKEFWMWVKVFAEFQEPSVTENVTFSEYKEICYSSWLIFVYLAVLFSPQGCLSVCDSLNFFMSFQQTISSCAPPIFV